MRSNCLELSVREQRILDAIEHKNPADIGKLVVFQARLVIFVGIVICLYYIIHVNWVDGISGGFLACIGMLEIERARYLRIISFLIHSAKVTKNGS
jgi:hypothetical protein